MKAVKEKKKKNVGKKTEKKKKKKSQKRIRMLFYIRDCIARRKRSPGVIRRKYFKVRTYNGTRYSNFE
jgi:hypothetical protein